MLDVLYRAERCLPKLLQDTALWRSLYVDYHPPFVERLWCQWEEDYRIYLHNILPCDGKKPLFHPHPWPSGMRVHGRYEMALGYGAGDEPPPIIANFILEAGSVYTMTDIDCWHSVEPTDGPAMSLMVTGKPWKRFSHKSDKQLGGLTAEREQALFNFFRRQYPG